MSLERDKFLTEVALKECWHDFVYSDTGVNRVYTCNKCGASRNFLPRELDFSSWQTFGTLFSAARVEPWWDEFWSAQQESQYCAFTVAPYVLNLIEPEIFANRLYSFLKYVRHEN